ncbi:MAG: pilin [Candidatus Saccharibacteria bacterium]|nr:pilin [Candidatus Saccharibacteria bacterium]
MKKILIGFTGLIISLGLFASPAKVSAGPFDAARDTACEGLEFNEGDSTSCNDSDGEKVGSTISNIVNLASLVVGVVAVIMVIVGGFKYVTSQGDSGGITSAKNTIIYAVVGLIIVALAQVIVRFVVNKTSDGTSTTQTRQDECEGVPSGVDGC